MTKVLLNITNVFIFSIIQLLERKWLKSIIIIYYQNILRFKKILNLIQKKYLWFVCAKQMKKYIQICIVYQRIKILRHKFYKKLVSEVSRKIFFMNFIIDLSSSKRESVVYNAILVIINKCTKIIKYLSMIIKIDVAKFTKLFFEKSVLGFDMSTNIVNDKDFLFINAFWSTFYYHAKIKCRLSTIFQF